MNGLYGESSTKTRLLLLVKKLGGVSLSQLSEALGISKAAVLKHVCEMEREGLLQRKYVPSGKGRPICKVSITERGHEILPKSYSFIAMEALDYVNEKIGREGVNQILQTRTGKILKQYGAIMENLGHDQRVLKLRELRDIDGYMAESRKLDDETFELCESNCPIMQISEKFSEACSTETHLFSELLGADVETTHRVVDGAKTCRFLIRYREKYE